MPSGSKKRAKQKQAAKSSSFKGAEELPSPTSDGARTPEEGKFPPVPASSSTDSQREAHLSNGTVQDTPKEQVEGKHLEPIVEKESAPSEPEQPVQTPTPAASESPAQAAQTISPPAAEAPVPPSTVEGGEKSAPAVEGAEKSTPAVEEAVKVSPALQGAVKSAPAVDGAQKNAAAAAVELPEPEALQSKVPEPVSTQAVPDTKAPVNTQAAESSPVPAPPQHAEAEAPEATELKQVAEVREPQVEETQQTQSISAGSSQDGSGAASTSTELEASEKNQLMVIPSEPEGVSCSGLMCWLFFPKGARPPGAVPRQRS